MPDDLVAGGIEDCDLTIEDHDERVTPVTDAIQHIAGVRRALLPERSEPRQLGRGQHWALGRWDLCHGTSLGGWRQSPFFASTRATVDGFEQGVVVS